MPASRSRLSSGPVVPLISEIGSPSVPGQVRAGQVVALQRRQDGVAETGLVGSRADTFTWTTGACADEAIQFAACRHDRRALRRRSPSSFRALGRGGTLPGRAGPEPVNHRRRASATTHAPVSTSMMGCSRRRARRSRASRSAVSRAKSSSAAAPSRRCTAAPAFATVWPSTGRDRPGASLLHGRSRAERPRRCSGSAVSGAGGRIGAATASRTRCDGQRSASSRTSQQTITNSSPPTRGRVAGTDRRSQARPTPRGCSRPRGRRRCR